MTKRQPDDQYSKSEANKRFQAALEAGLTTAPKPIKDKPKVRPAKRPGRP
jgi:hypothetical protein